MGWCNAKNEEVDGRIAIYCKYSTTGFDRCYKCDHFSKKKRKGEDD